MSIALISAESRKTVNHPIGKLRITLTDPYIDPEIEVNVNQENRASWKQQVADLVDETPKKWMSTNAGKLPDGTFWPMPSTSESALYNQVGWWGSVNSDENGDFATPPNLTVNFAPRPVFEVVVAGDDKLNEYPVNFYVDIGFFDGSTYTVLSDKNITDNAQVVRTLDFTEDDIINANRMRIFIYKWSGAGRVAKITEFYSLIVREFGPDDINSFSVLEEADGSVATVPVGNISANEMDAEFQNIDKQFTPFNENTTFFQLIKNNRRVEAFVGYRIDGGETIENYYIPKGVYWTGDWDFGEQKEGSSFSARDRLGLLQDIMYEGFSEAEDVPAEATYWEEKSLKHILTEVLNHIKFTAMPDLFFDIDDDLDSDIIDTAFFERKSVFEVIKEVAQAGLAYAYMDTPTEAERAENPPFMVDILRVKKIKNMIPQIESVVVENEYQITEGEYITKEQAQDTTSVVNTVDIKRKTFFIDEEEEPPQPKEISSDRWVYIVRDPDSVRVYGELKLVYDENNLIQKQETIDEIGQNILRTFKDANSNVSLSGFGDPTLKIGDRVVYPQFTDGEFQRLAYMVITSINTEYDGFLQLTFKGRRLLELPNEA